MRGGYCRGLVQFHLFSGNGQPALNVPLGYLNGVATDGAGNVYFTDPLEHLLLRVAPDGTLSVIAGNGIAAYSGDGGPATSAAIAASDSPEQYVGVLFEDSLGGIVVDTSGNLYFGDGHRVRRVATDGTISTVAGGGTQAPTSSLPATSASLGMVNGLALDSAGNLYFSSSNRVFKMTGGTLAPFAGTGANGFSGDGGQATAAALSQPQGLAFDAHGNLYVADGDVGNFASRIRMIAPNGTITTVAGGGVKTPANGLAPLTLNLSYASGLAVDATGAVYVFAPYAGTLLKFSNGSTTLITSKTPAAFTTGVPAVGAYVVGERPYDNSGIALDGSGNLYVADSRDRRLCKIDTNGVLTTVAGSGDYRYGGDGGPALSALIHGPSEMTQTPDGTLYFLDTRNARVRAISPSGVITTVMSAATYPNLGILEHLSGIASDANGNIYVLLVHVLVELTPNGTPQNISVRNSTSDTGPGVTAPFVSAGGLTRDAAGNFYVSDPGADKIFKITAAGIISTVAGTGIYRVSPDGAKAFVSPVAAPGTVLADNKGGLYFVEVQSDIIEGNVVRYITPSGLLTTVAGNGMGGFTDGVPAVQAGLMMLAGGGLALDQSGNLYLADGFNFRVRMVAPNGIISTVAGNGTASDSRDGRLATNAGLFVPQGLLFDAAGDLLISDIAGSRIRAVLAAPPAVNVSPVQMSFSAQAGGARTTPQKLAITSPVSGIGFTVSTDASANWVVLSATSGSTPELINVRADPSKLAAGSYQATLTIATPLATPARTTVTVTLQVTAGSPPQMALDKTGLSFIFPVNPTTSLTQTLTVSNTGTGALAFSARAQSGSGNWLSVSPASGSATPQTPATIDVTANPRGLIPGTYTGSVTLASSTTGQIVAVPITMTVSTLAQAIGLSHSALSFTAVAGGGVVPPGSFAVDNRGRGNMPFSISTQTLSGGQQWLSATPASGVAIGGAAGPIVTVRVNQTGLAPGFYYGLVRVDAPAAANTPHVVTVMLLVLDTGQDPGPLIVPSEIVITAVQGAPPPGSTNLLVYNVSGTPQTYVSDLKVPKAEDQIDFRPGTATLSLTQPTHLTVQPLTGALAPGVYDAELTLQFSDGNLRSVRIRTIIIPAPASSSATVIQDSATAVLGTARDATAAAGACTPSQLVPAITTLGQSFGVPAAWPVALEAQVLDDCGNPLSTGSVKVSFSNGDPPLSLQSAAGGMWNTTWVSGQNSGSVTLTLSAADPTGALTGTREVSGGLGASSQAPMLQAAVNGASFAAHTPLAPGALISLFGQGLANGSSSAATVPLGNTLAGASVVMAGNLLPLIFGSSGQINAVVSFGIGTNTSHQILVQRGNTISVPIPVDVGPVTPAIFSYPLPGDPASQGAIVNAVTYAVADPATPVTAGDVIAIFCAGLGAVNPTVPDAAASPTSPLAYSVGSPTVTIGGVPAPVAFSGLSPGFVGLYQIDATVPAGITPGSQVPVIVSLSGQTSPPSTIAVK